MKTIIWDFRLRPIFMCLHGYSSPSTYAMSLFNHSYIHPYSMKSMIEERFRIFFRQSYVFIKQCSWRIVQSLRPLIIYSSPLTAKRRVFSGFPINYPKLSRIDVHINEFLALNNMLGKSPQIMCFLSFLIAIYFRHSHQQESNQAVRFEFLLIFVQRFLFAGGSNHWMKDDCLISKYLKSDNYVAEATNQFELHPGWG